MSKRTLSQIVLIAFIFGFIHTSFAEENKNSNYTIYKNRVDDIICKEYKPGNESKKEKTQALLTKEIVYINPDSKTQTGTEQSSTFTGISDSGNHIIKAKGIYKNRMNDIYKCALLKIQIKELGNIKKLINIDKTGELGKSITQKIDGKIKKLEAIANNGGVSGSGSCTATKTDKEFEKTEVLKNVTYETCKYFSYLDFLRNYYDNISVLTYNNIGDKITNPDIRTSTVAGVSKEFNSVQSDIDNEESHAITTFPIAFQSYNEYAYNYPLHVLLEIIKEDLVIFRDKLHSTINPINQVVYKISNAMSK